MVLAEVIHDSPDSSHKGHTPELQTTICRDEKERERSGVEKYLSVEVINGCMEPVRTYEVEK